MQLHQVSINIQPIDDCTRWRDLQNYHAEMAIRELKNDRKK